MFLVVASNWIRTIISLKLAILPVGEIRSLSIDLNTTVPLSLLSIFNYFVAGIATFDEHSFKGYTKDGRGFISPIYILEELSKPFSLSFRLFGHA